MLNEKVAKLLNEQVNKEFYSAYLYLSFSNFYKELGLEGFAALSGTLYRRLPGYHSGGKE